MSLAYAEGKDGKLQVAYEAMDKVSIFKYNGWWIWVCPCHNKTSHHACFETAIYHKDDHLKNWHSEDD